MTISIRDLSAKEGKNINLISLQARFRRLNPRPKNNFFWTASLLKGEVDDKQITCKRSLLLQNFKVIHQTILITTMPWRNIFRLDHEL